MLVDADDYERIGGINWSLSHGYACNGRGADKVFLHRLLVGAPPDRKVDHRDRNPLNCRRENLRIATQSQNMMNVGKVRGSTPYKGVWRASETRWVAEIKADGKKTRLGRFSSPEEAARAYDEAARRHFGEFARLNFPGPGELPALEGPAGEPSEGGRP